jgi:hypothetical protein
MKNSRLLVALATLFGTIAPVRAQDPTPGAIVASSTDGASSTPSVVGQAAEAVVGRVFGVEGDASNIEYHVIEFTSHTPGAAATRSLLIPGWGQFFNRQKPKGAVFFLTTVGAIVASARLYDKANHSYDQYRALGDRDGSKYDDYRRDHNRAIIFGGAAAVIWIVSIFDAYHNAYKPLYSQASSVDVAFADGGAQLRLKKTF